MFNLLMPTVAIWVQLWSVLCQTGLSCHLYFLTSGHCDAQSWASVCPDVKNYKWQLNLVWHRTLYSCTHMATVGVKGLKLKPDEFFMIHGSPDVSDDEFLGAVLCFQQCDNHVLLTNYDKWLYRKDGLNVDVAGNVVFFKLCFFFVRIAIFNYVNAMVWISEL